MTLSNGEWKNFSVSMLRGPIHEALKIPEYEIHETELEGLDKSLPVKKFVKSQYQRRRPKLPFKQEKSGEDADLIKAKTAALKQLQHHEEERHEMFKEAFSLHQLLDKEKLKQEKIKTKLLEIELKEREQ